jgi:hypothetical protein
MMATMMATAATGQSSRSIERAQQLVAPREGAAKA